MRKFTLYDPNIGDVPLATALSETLAQSPVDSLTVLSTAQVGTLAAAQVAGATTFTASGTTGVTTILSTLTGSSVIAFGLSTTGGTPGTLTVASVDKLTGKVVVKSTPGDTSTYNIAAIG